VNVRNITGEVVYLGAHIGAGLRVEPGEVVEVEGAVVDQLDDAAVIGTPDRPDTFRAWPSSSWEVDSGKGDQ